MIAVFYASPALIALLLKCYFLSLVVKTNQDATKVLVALLACLSFLNMLEILFFVSSSEDSILLSLYYIAAMFSLMLISEFIFYLTRSQIPFFNIVHIFGLFLIPLFMFTPYIIKGAQPMGISITRVPGEYYYLFQIFVLLQLSTSIYLVIKTIFDGNKKSIIRAKSSVIFASFLPMFLAITIILFLMSLGVNINLVIILPITSTIFVWGCWYTVTNEKIIDLSTFIPVTPSWKRKRELLFFLYTGNDKSQVWDQLLKLERMYVEEAMIENKGKGQISNAAKDLGISPGKLDYRLKKIHQLDNN